MGEIGLCKLTRTLDFGIYEKNLKTKDFYKEWGEEFSRRSYCKNFIDKTKLGLSVDCKQFKTDTQAPILLA